MIAPAGEQLTKGLSGRERALLVLLHECKDEADPFFGVAVRDVFPGGWSRSESASVSRTTRRLAGRGLVVRHNRIHGLIGVDEVYQGGSRRATHLELTAAGERAAEHLANPTTVNNVTDDDVNRVTSEPKEVAA